MAPWPILAQTNVYPLVFRRVVNSVSGIPSIPRARCGTQLEKTPMILGSRMIGCYWELMVRLLSWKWQRFASVRSRSVWLLLLPLRAPAEALACLGAFLAFGPPFDRAGLLSRPRFAGRNTGLPWRNVGAFRGFRRRYCGGPSVGLFFDRGRLQCRGRLGGMLNYYYRAAA